MGQSSTAVVLPGVDRYRVTEAMSEGLRIILSYRGETYSPAYVQGISGAAFRMAGICPCAPTCSDITEPAELARKFGYQVEWWPFLGGGMPGEKEPAQILARVKDEIRQDRPVLLWHAFTNAEWDVVCGFDEASGELYGRGSYAGLNEREYARAPETRAFNCLDICPAMGAVFVGDKTGKLDEFAAEVGALREAVWHARREKPETSPDGKWVFLEGIQCYRRWAREFHDDAERGRTPGDSYCVGIYRSTHRAAAGFLRELAFKYKAAAPDLHRGEHAFEREAGLLDRCAPFLGWDTPEAPDRARSARLAGLLEKAGKAYEEGIGAVETALSKL